MQKFTTLADVVALAEFAHRNQTDKAGEPYINHPKRVLANVQAQGARPYVQMAAVLHDVTEDTAFTCDMLLALGIPEAAVRLIRLLDRDASAKEYAELYSGYQNPPGKDAYYYDRIASVPEARMIKLADINDNTLEWRLSYLPEEKQAQLRAKYAKALELLK